MFPFLASALLLIRRNPDGETDGPSEVERRSSLSPLVLLPPLSNSVPMMSSEPSQLTKSLDAMLKVLKGYVVPPLPGPPPTFPPTSVLLASVVERTVGLGSRVGTDTRGPFSVAALKGLRVEAVVRYQVWGATSPDVEQAIQDLISRLLGDRDALRAAGFLRVTLKSAAASENVFAEDAWRESVEFDVLYEFPYVDADDAESLIARIPINLNDEQFAESTIVTDEMVRWDEEGKTIGPPATWGLSAPPLVLRGPLSVGRLSALTFIPGTAPSGTVTLLRTFDGATGLPTAHPTFLSFLGAVAGANPSQRHAVFIFPSLTKFLAALATFKLTEQALDELKTDVSPAVLALLQGIKDQEASGEEEFLTLLDATIGVADPATKSLILEKGATLEPATLGDWDQNDLPDTYQAVTRSIEPIKLSGPGDRLEIVYENPALNQVAVVYLRATRGLLN